MSDNRWIAIRLPAEDTLKYIENWLKSKGVKFKVKKYYSSGILRIINVKIGLFKSIIIHSYPGHCYIEVPRSLEHLKSKLKLLPKYIEKSELKDKLIDHQIELNKLKIEAQIFERKIRNAKLGLAVTLILAITVMLLTSSFFLAIIISLITLFFPMGARYEPFEKCGIPVLYFKYKRDLEKLQNKIHKLKGIS